jgi:hypothetical protein
MLTVFDLDPNAPTVQPDMADHGASRPIPQTRTPHALRNRSGPIPCWKMLWGGGEDMHSIVADMNRWSAPWHRSIEIVACKYALVLKSK